MKPNVPIRTKLQLEKEVPTWKKQAVWTQRYKCERYTQKRISKKIRAARHIWQQTRTQVNENKLIHLIQ